jgi:hypothetical protein
VSGLPPEVDEYDETFGYKEKLFIFLSYINSEIRSTGFGPRLNPVLLSGSTTHHGRDYFYPCPQIA